MEARQIVEAQRQTRVLIGIALLIIGLLIGYNAINQNQSRQVYETTTQQQTVIVFVTNTGTKYHKQGCQYLALSSHQIEKQEAINKGYSPCSVCCNP